MWMDTTARNRAHQAFGKRNYGWLIFIKALPWITATIALCVLVGAERVLSAVRGTVDWFAASNGRSAVFWIGFTLVLFWLKAHWRRNDYRP